MADEERDQQQHQDQEQVLRLHRDQDDLLRQQEEDEQAEILDVPGTRPELDRHARIAPAEQKIAVPGDREDREQEEPRKRVDDELNGGGIALKIEPHHRRQQYRHHHGREREAQHGAEVAEGEAEGLTDRLIHTKPRGRGSSVAVHLFHSQEGRCLAAERAPCARESENERHGNTGRGGHGHIFGQEAPLQVQNLRYEGPGG